MRLGDLALLADQPTRALEHYQAAEQQLPALALQVSADSASLLEPQLFAHYSLALRRDGQVEAAEAAASRALSAAEELQSRFPQWSAAAYAAGYVQLVQGGSAEALFTQALACDGSLSRAVEWAPEFIQELQ